MSRTRVKICGITSAENGLAVVSAGADAVGLNFYPQSPRFVTVEKAVEIANALPPFVCKVALFVNAERALIEKVIAAVKPQLLQFHGDESPEECAHYQCDYIKAIRVNHDTNLIQCAEDYSLAQALLLDTYTKGVPGGTGKTFNWALIPDDMPLPVILAGGLDATNVASAIRQVKPYAVDVSGGVESAKGVKSPEKMTAFMQQVAQA